MKKILSWFKDDSSKQQLKPQNLNADVYVRNKPEKLEELRKQRDPLQKQLEILPKVKDDVIFKLGNKRGQVIRCIMPEDKIQNPYGGYGYLSYSIQYNDDEERLKMHIYFLESEVRRINLREYDIRLEDGSIIGNLRYWEIERVNDKVGI